MEALLVLMEHSCPEQYASELQLGLGEGGLPSQEHLAGLYVTQAAALSGPCL